MLLQDRTQEASSLTKCTSDYKSTAHPPHHHHFNPRRNLCKHSQFTCPARRCLSCQWCYFEESSKYIVCGGFFFLFLLIVYSRYPFVLTVRPKSQENQCSRLHCLAVCSSSTAIVAINIDSWHLMHCASFLFLITKRPPQFGQGVLIGLFQDVKSQAG